MIFGRFQRGFIFSVATTAMLCAGCAGKIPIQSIEYPQPVAIEPVVNETGSLENVPRLEQPVKVYPLPLYEQLVYDIRWMGMRVGTVTATIKGVTMFENREMYDFELTAISNSWLGKIYHIDSRFESLMDVETMATYQQLVDRREGTYRKDATVHYDQKNQSASFFNRTDNSQKVYPIPAGVLDALSSIYYFRTLNLEPGSDVAFPVDVGEKIYAFGAKIGEEKMIRISGFKPQRAVYVQPYVTFEDENAKKGRVSGYFSLDYYHIPLNAVLEAPLFTKVTVTLKELSYNKDDDLLEEKAL